MTPNEIEKLAGHRTVSPWVMKLVLEAVELEREACAKACEELKATYELDGLNGTKSYHKAAAAIRARGQS